MNFSMKKVYMDYAASTPVDKKVQKEIGKYKDFFANPTAIHGMGVVSGNHISSARQKIAKIMSCHQDEIFFTGNATESISLAIQGAVYDYHKNNKDKKSLPHIITTNIEHKAVIENFNLLKERGLAEISFLEVGENGILDIKNLKENIKENTILISVCYANNEIGTIQDIEEVAREIRRLKKQNFFNLENKNYPFFHTDATQAINYLFIKNMEKLGVDMMSFNGSKIYGPKGIGILYKKRKVNIEPLYTGGGQESGLRPGTENLESIMGVARALEIVEEMKDKECARLQKLRNLFIEKIKILSSDTGYNILINGDEEKRLPNNINISIEKISNELVLIELDARGIMVSTKSACSAGDEGVSHVLKAIRKESLSNKILDSLRFSLGRDTKEKDIFYTINSLEKILMKYKNML